MSEADTLAEALDALLPPQDAAARATPAAAVEMSIGDLRPGRYQPRQQTAQDGLGELAASIREQGVLQPLLVRAIPRADRAAGPAYEIVAGERRWRAAKMAGLARVPVIVRELDDQSALAVALIENLQREDLNPIDQARSLSRLATEFGLTHEQVAQAVGRSRPAISNLLRLLELADEVKAMLADGKLDMGHARALLPLDPERQVTLARKTERRRLSVRQVEKAVTTLLHAATSDAAARRELDLQTRWLQGQLGLELGRRLTIRPGRTGGYTLQLDFDDLAELEQALHRIAELIGTVRHTAGPRARDEHD